MLPVRRYSRVSAAVKESPAAVVSTTSPEGGDCERAGKVGYVAAPAAELYDIVMRVNESRESLCGFFARGVVGRLYPREDLGFALIG